MKKIVVGTREHLEIYTERLFSKAANPTDGFLKRIVFIHRLEINIMVDGISFFFKELDEIPI